MDQPTAAAVSPPIASTEADRVVIEAMAGLQDPEAKLNTVAPARLTENRRAYSDLVQRTRYHVQGLNKARGHNPSPEMMNALMDIPRTIDAIRKGKADPTYHVCPLDTGVGKTTTLAESIKALRALDSEDRTGVVICAGRHEQIEALIADMGMKTNEYAVLVSEYTEKGQHLSSSGLGFDRINEAPVLFTTHAMVQKRLMASAKGTNPIKVHRTCSLSDGSYSPIRWADASEFFYQGKPRQIRIWDETAIPGLPVLLKEHEIHAVLGVPNLPRPIWTVLDQLLADIKSAKDGEVYNMADFGDIQSLDSLLGSLSYSVRAAHRETLTKVWMLSKRAARFRHDGYGTSPTMLSFFDRFPQDMKPLIVLDASARVSTIYKHQAQTYGDVSFLADATKRYDNVSVHLHKGPSGKGSAPKYIQERAQEVAKIINGHDPSSTLVIAHKAQKGADWCKSLTQLTDPSSNFAFLPWGSHNGINHYQDRSVIIVPSTLHLPKSKTEATGRIVSGLSPDLDYPEERFEEVENGEIRSDWLQAISRGCIRVCEGEQAKPAEVHVWFDRVKLAGQWLSEMFPGAKLYVGERLLKPGEVISAPRVARAWDVVEGRFAASDDPVALPVVYRAAGIAKQHAKSQILNNPGFQARLESAALMVAKRGRTNYIMRVADAF